MVAPHAFVSASRIIIFARARRDANSAISRRISALDAYAAVIVKSNMARASALS